MSADAALPFQAVFRQNDAEAARGKYLARLFGIFSETLVDLWCRDARSPYENLGRPTVHHDGKRHTLDFLFRDRRTGRIHVVEQKCEIEYQGYRYLTLTEPRQLDHHRKPAFAAFLAAARGERLQVTLKGTAQPVDGAILIWGAVDARGRASTLAETGLDDIVALADVIADLQAWRPEAYVALIKQRRKWAGELFDFLDRRC
ncbi:MULTISPECIES: hypothetical protein [unclassified Sphingopyxis]|uniref:hypothetical protein n=1 Tax=Sphingopyxis sp. DBS4 TaxID=2968500 RepID=UPI00214C1163|nr:hypothetical protein [Sphingopyxis sp. DBS4]